MASMRPCRTAPVLRILHWFIVSASMLQTGWLHAQRVTNPENPQGKWEVLDRCRLVTDSAVDGDSFRILSKGREYGIRLYFVDAPEGDAQLRERVQAQAAYFGISVDKIPEAAALAARFTREKLSGREFTLQTRWQNAMGRGNVARFYCEVFADGKNLGEELVAHGWARVHGVTAIRPDGTPAATVVNHLKNLELSAREKRLGIWDTNQFPRLNPGTLTRGPAVPRPITPQSPLDPNTATYEELQQLTGIGPTLAERIIAHRPYKTVEDLEKVPGIGKKTIEKLRPLLRVNRPQ